MKLARRQPRRAKQAVCVDSFYRGLYEPCARVAGTIRLAGVRIKIVSTQDAEPRLTKPFRESATASEKVDCRWLLVRLFFASHDSFIVRGFDSLSHAPALS